MSLVSKLVYRKILLLRYADSYIYYARIAVCISLVTLLSINDTTEILALPAKNIRQNTLLSPILSYFNCDNLPVFRDYWILSSIRYLSLFSLVLAGCGFAIRTNLVIGAITYTLHYHHIISYTHFFHSGLIPLQILYVLCLTNHNYQPRHKSGATLSNQVAIFCIYLIYGLSYFCAGLSKLKVSPFWGSSDNLKIFMLSDSLSLIEFDFNLMPKYFASGYSEWPISILGIATIIIEVSAILVPFSNKARRYFPIAIMLLHIGIFLGHEFIFIDLLILPIILFAPYTFHNSKILKFTFIPIQETKLNITEKLAPLYISAIILSACFFRIEQFPIFTAWGMYAINNQDKERVSYLKIYCIYQNGEIKRSDLREFSGILSHARFQDIIGFNPENIEYQAYLKELLAHLIEYNQQKKRAYLKVAGFRIELWEWQLSEKEQFDTYGILKDYKEILI